MTAEDRSPWWESTGQHPYVPHYQIPSSVLSGGEPRPPSENHIRRARLSATIHRLARTGELDEDLAWMFPIAAGGGDIERDFARYVDVLLRRALIALLVVVVGISGVVWLLMKVWQ